MSNSKNDLTTTSDDEEYSRRKKYSKAGSIDFIIKKPGSKLKTMPKISKNIKELDFKKYQKYQNQQIVIP